MDDLLVGEFSWEGLACPPLDVHVFQFDTTCSKFDDVLNDQFFDIFEDDCVVPKKPILSKPVRSSGTKIDVKNTRVRGCGNNGKGKELRTVLKVVEASEAERTCIEAFLAEEENNKKRKFYDCPPMQPPKIERKVNQVAVVNDKWKADCDTRMEETIQKLHKSYNRFNEAKQRRKIQVIEFQKPVFGQQRCTVKPKGKGVGNFRNKKKFQPLVY